MPHLDLTQVLSMPWAIPVIMGCSIGMVSIVGGVITNCITKVAETSLKRSMVDRGFTAAEIQQVLTASGDDPVTKSATLAKPEPKPSF